MKYLPLIILFGIIFSSSISVCRADGSYHLQVVNQELDRIESSVYNQVMSVPVPASLAPVSASGISQSIAHPSIIRKRVELNFGPDFYWAKYRQPGIYNQHGFMTGYDGGITYRTASLKPLFNMYRLEGQWAGGKFNNPSYGYDGIKDTTYDLRGLLGHDFYPLSYLRATGYSGFGYRYLDDDPQGLTGNPVVTDTGSTGNTTGYKTKEHYCYIPVGIDLLYQTSRRSSLESNFEFDYVAKGWEDSALAVLQEGYGTIVNDQDTGIGLRGSVKLNLYFKTFDAYAEAFFRYWRIEQSRSILDPVDPVDFPPIFIPKNDTEEFGLRFGIEK